MIAGEKNQGEFIQNREKATDGKVHIEEKLTLDIPEVPRFCDEMKESEKGYVQIDKDCRLYVEQEGEGAPIVLLHGGPGTTHHGFHPEFSQLADSNKVISYDQRGCVLSGRHEGEGYSIDQAVEDLEKLRKTLGLKSWTLLGHSNGGLIAQEYARKYPENCKGLILTCANAGLPGLDRDMDILADEEINQINTIFNNSDLIDQQKVYNALLNGFWKRQLRYKPTPKEMAQVALYESDIDKTDGKKIGENADTYDLEGVFKDLSIPTLILEGEYDTTWHTDKAKKLQENHPNAKMVMFEDSAHNPFKDQPSRFFEEVRGFVGGLPD